MKGANGPWTSLVTSVAMALAVWVMGLLAGHHLVPEGDVGQGTEILAQIIGAAVFAGFAWFKASLATQDAKIKAINAARNGVKVVDEAVRAPEVNSVKKS